MTTRLENLRIIGQRAAGESKRLIYLDRALYVRDLRMKVLQVIDASIGTVGEPRILVELVGTGEIYHRSLLMADWRTCAEGIQLTHVADRWPRQSHNH